MKKVLRDANTARWL